LVRFYFLLGSTTIRVAALILEVLATGLGLGKVVLSIHHLWAHDLVEILLADKSCAISVKVSFVFSVYFFAIVHY
jgi:hypothetical protein